MPRKSTSNGNQLKPLIPFTPPIPKKRMTVEVDEPEAEKLQKYPKFVKETTGASPSVDEVLVRALQYFFSRDKGFQAYLERSSTDGGNRQPASSEPSK